MGVIVLQNDGAHSERKTSLEAIPSNTYIWEWASRQLILASWRYSGKEASVSILLISAPDEPIPSSSAITQGRNDGATESTYLDAARVDSTPILQIKEFHDNR
jgi:hypothetical protein